MNESDDDGCGCAVLALAGLLLLAWAWLDGAFAAPASPPPVSPTAAAREWEPAPDEDCATWGCSPGL